MQSETVLDPNELQETAPASAEMPSLFKNRNFLLLWAGEAISLLGDQFHLIALPWLVLQLTGDALAVGGVLAVAGIPRALFMLLGGAITDRFSPRNVMLGSNLARMLLVGGMAAIVLSGQVELWMLYGLALAFGLADAFFFPAQSAMVPRLIPDEQLQAGNAITQATAQVSLFLGPVLAGGLIALFGASAEGDGVDLRGIGLAFVVDAVTFLASAVTLWFIRVEREARAETDEGGMISAVGESLRYVWKDRILRTAFPVIALISMLSNAIFAVGIPVLADTRYDQGAAAFGLIMSGFGLGMLIGIGLAGVLPKVSAEIRGAFLFAVTSLMGLGAMAFVVMDSAWLAAGVAALMGIANGYVVIQYITWLQLRTPDEMLGRMMSLVMFASIGLAPVATVFAGVVADWNLNWLFVGGGALVTLVSLWAAVRPEVRALPEHEAVLD